MLNRNALRRQPPKMRTPSSRTKIVRKMTMREKLEGGEEGKKLLKRKRTRRAALLPALTM